MPRRPAHDPSVRRRANRKPSAATLDAPDEPLGPDLPSTGYRDGARHVRWLKVTRDLWESLRTDPRASAYTDADWAVNLSLAMLHDRAWRGDAKAAAEFRLLAVQQGLTRAGANAQDWTLNPKVTPPPDGGREPRSARGRAQDFRVHDGDADEEAS